MKINRENVHEFITHEMQAAHESTTVLYVPCSKDAKTGLVSAVYTAESTCPASCPFKGSGCYAENFRCKMAWQRAIMPITAMPEKAEELGRLDLVRVNIAGDLAMPGTDKLNLATVDWYIRNWGGKSVLWSYTHCKPTPFNKAVVRYACENGFTISFSCESLSLANALHVEGLPVVVATDRVKVSDDTYYVCQGGKNNITCRKCKLCTKVNRKKIVVFNLHGTRKAAAQKAVEGIE